MKNKSLLSDHLLWKPQFHERIWNSFFLTSAILLLFRNPLDIFQKEFIWWLLLHLLKHKIHQVIKVR